MLWQSQIYACHGVILGKLNVEWDLNYLISECRIWMENSDENLKVALLSDNFLSNLHLENSQATQYLHKIVKSHLQPMRCCYTFSQVQITEKDFTKLFRAISHDLLFPRISIFETIKFPILKCNNVTEDTIPNCFCKTSISNDKQVNTRNDSDDCVLLLFAFPRSYKTKIPQNILLQRNLSIGK